MIASAAILATLAYFAIKGKSLRTRQHAGITFAVLCTCGSLLWALGSVPGLRD